MSTEMTTEQAADEWMRVLCTEKDKRRIRIAINRGLRLPDRASTRAQMHAAHVTDGRKPEEQAAAYLEAYRNLEPLPDVDISDERRLIADWLDAEANRQDVNGFEPNEVAHQIRAVAARLRTDLDVAAEVAVTQARADEAEKAWLREHGVGQVNTEGAEPAAAATSRRMCRSRNRFGRCGLASKHGGNHAVPIGDGVWYAYAYEQGGRVPVGYGKFLDGQWVAL